MIARWVAHELIPGELDLHLDATLPYGARPRARVWIGLHTGAVFWCVNDRDGAPVQPTKTEAASVWQAQRTAQQRLLVMLKEEAARATASLAALEDLEREAAIHDHKHQTKGAINGHG